ncbi:MAG: response regulator transcription factor [Sulfurovum sp.]|nr:response regulator transcription factor [Sulfurovum sp.]
MNCEKSLKNLTVLFVEDEESLLQMLVSALGSHFGDYNIAKNGTEGLLMAQREKPDIIISDITMPEMDGLTMAEKIHLDMPSLPIIILSAYSDQDKLLHAIDLGITKYFIKPFDPDELLEYLCMLAKKIENSQQIKLSDSYRYDSKNKKLLKNQHIVKLTTRELSLIAYLIDAPNHIISNEKIKELIGKDGYLSDESVRVFIRRLREKTDKNFVQNLPKQGYLLTVS